MLKCNNFAYLCVDDVWKRERWEGGAFTWLYGALRSYGGYEKSDGGWGVWRGLAREEIGDHEGQTSVKIWFSRLMRTSS